MRPASLIVLALVGCAAPPPCHHTLEHVGRFDGTVDGPRELAAIVRSPDEPLEVRVAAAQALAVSTRSDHDPRALLLDALGTTASEPSIQAGLTERIVAALHEDPHASTEAARVQVAAKDAAVLLAPRLDEPSRAAVRDAVMAWYLRAFAERQHLGHTRLEDALAAFGESSREALLDGLDAERGPTNLLAVVELFATAPEPWRSRAATRLVETERTLRGEAFATYMRGRLREQLSRVGEDLDDEATVYRIESALAINRRQFLEGVFAGMRRFCDDAEVADRLVAAATDDDEAEDVRVRALQALEGCARSGDVDALLELAFDGTAAARVRDYAFDRLAELDEPRIAERLWRELPDADAGPLGWRLRWRVGALLLLRVDASAIPRFFAALPDDGEYAREELTGYAERLATLGAEAQRALRDAIRSERWFVRVIALLALPLEEGASLANDTAPLRGAHWEPWATIGDVARRDPVEER
ncbi:MAG: hypothetical protein KC619_34985 [Myxococcales bacterium]|nr:hypothetical protein [Myxococcales bacterium]